MEETSTKTIERIAVLHSELSGYMSASLKQLHERYDVDLLVFHWQPVREAPFTWQQFSWIGRLYAKEKYTRSELIKVLEQFEPQAILMAGWMDSDYLYTARHFKKHGIPVIAGSDTQWQGTWRQHLGRWAAPWYLHRAIDVLWVAGERQRQFAQKLGYAGKRCWEGCYACDWDRFSQNGKTREIIGSPSFLYIGRYVNTKGIDVLVEAYRSYRSMVQDPWPLICAGSGDQQSLLDNQEGIHHHGFIQPEQLPDLMRNVSAFVLPSRKEPWGVVVQEAAASGLPLICSDASGAAVHLLRDGFNGFLFESGNSKDLARCMLRMSQAEEKELLQMGKYSFSLSKQFTPQLWADTLYRGLQTLG